MLESGAPDGWIPPAEGVDADGVLIPDEVLIVDGVSIRYWKKLYWTGDEPDALAGDPAAAGEPGFARLGCGASEF